LNNKQTISRDFMENFFLFIRRQATSANVPIFQVPVQAS